jgi:multiple sugar transport system ATP-binding protein
MTMADRIVVMRAGQIEQIGTPLEIYRRPTNLFVATFFGTPTMNIITGQISRDGAYHFQAPKLDITLAEPIVPTAAVGQQIALGVRPEHIHLGDTGVPAEVLLTEPLGDETLVFFDYGGDAEMVAKMGGDCELKVGDHVHFTVNFGGILFFDTPGGVRLA